MTSRSESRPRVRVPLVLVPLMLYVGVTVIAPILNGATRLDGFWEHAGLTLAVSVVMTALWLGARAAARWTRARTPARLLACPVHERPSRSTAPRS